MINLKKTQLCQVSGGADFTPAVVDDKKIIAKCPVGQSPITVTKSAEFPDGYKCVVAPTAS